MNTYDVMHVNGDVYEIEADFYQREGDDWTFYAGDEVILRISWFDVLSVSKSSLRPRPVDEPVTQVWL